MSERVTLDRTQAWRDGANQRVSADRVRVWYSEEAGLPRITADRVQLWETYTVESGENNPPTDPGTPTPDIAGPYDTATVTFTWPPSTDPDADAPLYPIGAGSCA